ncbi:MAG: ATP phosphoribosyltransferase regulatory subunit, partial [Halobacteria archaeon]|nr:ATP phosphoribosyltransferase regulatory subunit [Halobacteria archaeon]
VLFYDLAELRGYNFHTGMVFAVFVLGRGQEIARGGRYNDIGKVFGGARPATGFSMDLKTLVDLDTREYDLSDGAIFSPADSDPALIDTVRALRAAGERVLFDLPGQNGDAAAMGCNRVIVHEDGAWVVKPV